MDALGACFCKKETPPPFKVRINFAGHFLDLS